MLKTILPTMKSMASFLITCCSCGRGTRKGRTSISNRSGAMSEPGSNRGREERMDCMLIRLSRLCLLGRSQASLEEAFEIQYDRGNCSIRIRCAHKFPALLTHLVAEIGHRRVCLCLFPVGLLLFIDLLELPSLRIGQPHYD